MELLEKVKIKDFDHAEQIFCDLEWFVFPLG